MQNAIVQLKNNKILISIVLSIVMVLIFIMRFAGSRNVIQYLTSQPLFYSSVVQGRIREIINNKALCKIEYNAALSQSSFAHTFLEQNLTGGG